MTLPTSKPKVTIYTDGGCDPNPGPGGWAAILIFEKEDGSKVVKELSGGEADTTNNRMEITAAIQALRALKTSCEIEFYSDSQYLINAITEWMPGWLKTDFKKGKLENIDLWKTINPETARHQIRWHWVKGHAGNQYNERADQLAVAATPGSQRKVNAIPSDATRVFWQVSCKGNPGLGAYAVLLEYPDNERVLTGGHPKVTANRLDLMALIAVLESTEPAEVLHIFCGSKYVFEGAQYRLSYHKRNGWKTKEGTPVAHQDLWQTVDRLLAGRKLFWTELVAAAFKDELAQLQQPLKNALELARA